MYTMSNFTRNTTYWYTHIFWEVSTFQKVLDCLMTAVDKREFAILNNLGHRGELDELFNRALLK